MTSGDVDATTATPATILASDPGDETQRRFRYQATIAAIYAVGLLRLDITYNEVYCEQHEDVLIHFLDGTFGGVQVKTRSDGYTPFKASDEPVLTSLKRFLEHEQQFPGLFSQYVFSSNCGCWSEVRNGRNLDHLLELASAVDDSHPELVDGILRQFIEKDGKLAIRANQHTLATLKKVRTHRSPGLDDADGRLIQVLADIPGWQTRRCLDVAAAARALVNEVLRASARPQQASVCDYVALLTNPRSKQAEAAIAEKRFTRERVENILESAVSPDGLLHPLNPIAIRSLPGSFTVMARKMAAGGLSTQNIDLTRDLKNSMEILAVEWLHKYGPKRAQDQHGDVAMRVRVDSLEAHDSVAVPDQEYGQSMLQEVRERLHRRYEQEKQCLFGCSYEHLLGMVGILTEDCRVWWSAPFDFEQDGLT